MSLGEIRIQKLARAYQAGIVLAFMVLLTGLWSLPVQADGIIHKVTLKPRPSLPGKPWPFTTYYGCYSYYYGEPVNCTFTHQINGLKKPESDADNNGGHFHFANRPLSLNNKPLLHSGDLDPNPFGVTGFTSSSSSQRYGKVVHEMPEVVG